MRQGGGAGLACRMVPARLPTCRPPLLPLLPLLSAAPLNPPTLSCAQVAARLD